MTLRPSQTELRRGESATWGVRPRLTLRAFKEIRRNSLRGFATVELPIGLVIADVPVLVSHGKAWATLPSKPQIDRDGQVKHDDNGRVAYSAMLEWRDRGLANRLSAAAIEGGAAGRAPSFYPAFFAV